ncbi:MAG: class I SAM-dependent methyltransferase [Verrucomicrobia bacterium]|nr:class I SAM-dependent methyltransferase [Verrucomicrobiota bacterium]
MKPPIKLNPRAGWQGWCPGWVGMMDPENGRIAAFLQEEAARLAGGARVLDAGAGTRPYAEYFSRQKYESCDMPGGFYKQQHDFECFLHAIPQPDNSYDAIINTQVLEHVPDPLAVMRELNRVLKPGGRLLLTVPFTAPLHAEPWNFFQFTHYGIAELARQSNFEVAACEKMGGAFWALGKRLPEAFRKWLKQYDPTRAKKRGQSLTRSIVMTLLLFVPWLICYPISGYVFRPLCYWLDRLDIEKSFTLGYTIVLVKKSAA